MKQEINRSLAERDLASHRILRRAGDDWRAKARARGRIRGLEDIGTLTILAANHTTGEALFVDDNGLPHIAHYGWWDGQLAPRVGGTGGPNDRLTKPPRASKPSAKRTPRINPDKLRLLDEI